MGAPPPPVGRWGDAVGSRPYYYLYTAKINCVASIRSSACMAWTPSSPQRHSGHEQVASGPGCGVRSCLPHVGIGPAINPGYLPPHTTNSLLVGALACDLNSHRPRRRSRTYQPPAFAYAPAPQAWMTSALPRERGWLHDRTHPRPCCRWQLVMPVWNRL